MRSILGIMAACVAMVAHTSVAAELDIYFIDVEGGQATLVVTPEKQALLIDAGFPGAGSFESKAGTASSARDPQRIMAAARDAGVDKIDILLITHMHRDHLGGVSELAQLLPIETFVDYGDPVPADKITGPVDALDAYAFDTYAKVRARARHVKPRPGDRLPLKGVEAVVVSTDRSVLAKPLAGAGIANKACGAAAIAPGDVDENPRSTGILLQYGKFRFLDLGDLAGGPLFDLACPTDRIGPVDVYLVAHHGGADAADPGTFAAFKPRATVINNGARKGGQPEVMATLRRTLGVQDVWQLHRAASPGADNVAQEQIANLDERSAHWIRVKAKADGSFKLLNGRTGLWKDYAAR